MTDNTFETEIRSMITGLLASSPLALTIKKLEYDFKNMIGESIPFRKLGFFSTEEYLRSIPESVQIVGRGPNAELRMVVTKKSAHISEMVMKQKVASKKKFPRNRPIFVNRQHEQHRQSQNIQYGMEKPAAPIYKTDVKKTIQIPTSSETCNVQPQKQYYNQENIQKPQTAANVPLTNNEIKQSKEIKITQKPTQIEHSQNKITTNEYIPKEAQPQLTQNQLRTRSLIPVIPNNHQSYEKPFLSTLTSNKQTSQINRNLNKNKVFDDSDQYTGFTIEKTKLTTSASKKIDGFNTDRIPRRIQLNLKTLIATYPDGLWCLELPKLYKTRFNATLDYSDFGYQSLIQFCMNLPEIFHYVRPSTSDFKLYDRSKPLPENAIKELTMKSYNIKNKALGDPLPHVELSQYLDFLPKDIVDTTCDVQREFVPGDTKEGDYIDIVIGEIFDLSKFWIYLSDNGLDELMDELQSFYYENGNQYICPELLFEEGLLCATMFHNEYHRAIIIKVWTDQPDVKVLFVDYGTVCKVPKKSICLLSKKFTELKYQAIRASLANIYPPVENSTWSRRDTQIFLERVRGRTIVGQINKIYQDKQQLDLYLIDKETGECINELLVKDKIALFTTQEREKKIINTYFHPKVKYLHLFPSFTELEYGLAPSTADVNMCTNLYITYDHLFPQYFDRKTDEDIIEDIEMDHTQFIEQARETYRKRSLFSKLNEPDIQKLHENSYFDMSLFGTLEKEISTLIKKKSNERKHKKLHRSQELDLNVTATGNSDKLLIEDKKTKKNKSKDDVVKWLKKNLQDDVTEYETEISKMVKEPYDEQINSPKPVNMLELPKVTHSSSSESGSSLSTLVNNENNKIESEIKSTESKPVQQDFSLESDIKTNENKPPVEDSRLESENESIELQNVNEPEEVVESQKNFDSVLYNDNNNESEVKCDNSDDTKQLEESSNEIKSDQNKTEIKLNAVELSISKIPTESATISKEVYYPWSNPPITYDQTAVIQPINRVVGPPPGFQPRATFNRMSNCPPTHPNYQIPQFFAPQVRFGQPIHVYQNSYYFPPPDSPDFFAYYNQYLMYQQHQQQLQQQNASYNFPRFPNHHQN